MCVSMRKFLPTLWAYNQTRDMDDMDQDHTELYIELAETAKEHTDDLLDRDLWLSSPAYPKTMAMFGS